MTVRINRDKKYAVSLPAPPTTNEGNRMYNPKNNTFTFYAFTTINGEDAPSETNINIAYTKAEAEKDTLYEKNSGFWKVGPLQKFEIKCPPKKPSKKKAN